MFSTGREAATAELGDARELRAVGQDLIEGRNDHLAMADDVVYTDTQATAIVLHHYGQPSQLWVIIDVQNGFPVIHGKLLCTLEQCSSSIGGTPGRMWRQRLRSFERRENLFILAAVSRGDFELRGVGRYCLESVASGSTLELVGNSSQLLPVVTPAPRFPGR